MIKEILAILYIDIHNFVFDIIQIINICFAAEIKKALMIVDKEALFYETKWATSTRQSKKDEADCPFIFTCRLRLLPLLGDADVRTVGRTSTNCTRK